MTINIHHDNPATGTTTWRDLADQLTAEQVANLELVERDAIRYRQSADALVRIAQSMIVTNLDQIRLGDIAAPADAIDTGLWEDDGDGGCQRSVIFWKHPGVPEAVQVIGEQHDDGTVTNRLIYGSADLEAIDASTARAIAAALVLAADELDRIDGGAR